MDGGPGKRRDVRRRTARRRDRRMEKRMVNGNLGWSDRGRDDPRTWTGRVPSIVSGKHREGSCLEVNIVTWWPLFLRDRAASTTRRSAPPCRVSITRVNQSYLFQGLDV